MSTQSTDPAKTLQAENLKWEAHPKFKGMERAYLLNKRDDNFGVTMALDRWLPGAELDRHTHQDCDDIFYIIKGKAKIWLDGIGDVPLVTGSFVKVPKGLAHQPHSVEQETLCHHTWFPATY